MGPVGPRWAPLLAPWTLLSGITWTHVGQFHLDLLASPGLLVHVAGDLRVNCEVVLFSQCEIDSHFSWLKCIGLHALRRRINKQLMVWYKLLECTQTRLQVTPVRYELQYSRAYVLGLPYILGKIAIFIACIIKYIIYFILCHSKRLHRYFVKLKHNLRRETALNKADTV